MGRILQSSAGRGLWRPIPQRQIYTPQSLCYADLSNSTNEKKQEAIKKLRIAVIAHVFYDDIWEELKSYIDNIPVDFDLYLTMIENRVYQPALNATDKVFIVPNKGFDVGPFIYALHNIDLSQYDLVCKIHTKKSFAYNDIALGIQQRSQLLSGVLDSQIKITNILHHFFNSDVGMVGSRHRLMPLYLDCNYSHLNKLFKDFSMHIPYHKVSFIGGTMFWVRSDVLQAIKDGPLNFDMFEQTVRNGQIAKDGQLAHSVERLFGAITCNLGYRVVGV